MSTKFFALLTHVGAARLANVTALGSRLDITHMAVGDGGGTLPTPDPAQTKLVNEKRRAAINTLSIDANNANQIIAEQVIPENEGGFWIREVGLFDAEGNLIAVANCAESYKPQLQEGSGRTQTVRMILIVSSTESVTLKIDPAVVLATRAYVDGALVEHEKSRKHPDGTLTAKGLVQLSSATDSTSETLAATPKAVKAANDNANGRVPSGRKVNGKALSADIVLSASDVGAYSKAESDSVANGKLDKSLNGADIPNADVFRKNIGLASAMLRGDFGFGGRSKMLGTVDTEKYFNLATPSGFYVVGGDPTLLKIPLSDAFLQWEVFGESAAASYGVLRIIGFYNPQRGEFRQFYKILKNGVWRPAIEVFNDACRLINGEVSNTTNPFKGIGFYNAEQGNWPRQYGVVLQSYLKDAGAISLMQRAVSNVAEKYELWGRNVIVREDGTASYGEPVEFYHSGNKPNALDVGAYNKTETDSALALKMDKSQNGGDIPDKAAFLSNLVYRGELVDGGTFAACNQPGIYRVAVADGNTISDMPINIRGDILYSYGFLVVQKISNAISQTYLPHRGPVAMRQQWDGISYSLGWNVMLGNSNMPTATDVGAFPLGFTGNATETNLAWDANSGVYKAVYPGASQMIVHFGGTGASCSALQFLAEYGNGGLSYRTSRDNAGFESAWERIYTTGFKPNAADIGAFTKEEADDRYLQNIRFGEVSSTYTPPGTTTDVPEGCVMTGVVMDTYGSRGTSVIHARWRPLQKNINGVWHTVSQL